MCKPSPHNSYSQKVSLIGTGESSYLNLLSFNVENLKPKFDEPSFLDLLFKHDICVLCETWNKDDSKLGLPGYWDFSQVRPKYKKVGRYSEGIQLFRRYLNPS